MTEPEQYDVAAGYRAAISRQEQKLQELLEQKPRSSTLGSISAEETAWMKKVSDIQSVLVSLRVALARETHEDLDLDQLYKSGDRYTIVPAGMSCTSRAVCVLNRMAM